LWGFSVTQPDPEGVTRILAAAKEGDEQAADELLPLVYDQLRRLAQNKMAGESPGHTLQATALVHEAYLRLLGDEGGGWKNRRHFFAAAAEAMRRILIERARRYDRARHGGRRKRELLRDVEIQCELPDEDLLGLDQAIRKLADVDRRAYDVVMLRFFACLEIDQIAEMLDVSPSTIDRDWRSARVWLYDQVRESAGDDAS
jgi:RNA polymerase sigma factor (TIGR02999 family)